MFALIVRRTIQSIVVMLVVALLAFTMFRYVGDPVAMLVGQETSLQERAALREKLGLNDPVPIQFGRFVINTAQGKFGISYQIGRPVSELISERLPATLELSLLAALFSLLAGIPMGVYTALRPDRWLSHFFLTLSLVGISLPTFLIGILLILLFGVILGWLPTFGRGDVVTIGWWTTGLLTVSGIKSLLMPAFTLGMFQLTLIMRLVRSEMLEVLRTDYIKFARARGLTNRAVNFGHALK
ncbi:MAG: ABC transporter permease, partial [Candidatus Glassbacteria bacterium]|nr:ABC transporter permease [Candidatus Glassbacteria bacterium]